MATVVTSPGLYVTPEMDESGPEDLKKPLSSEATVFLDIFSWITHLFLGAAGFCGLVAGFMYIRGPIQPHVLLCTTGYIIMVSLAVLTLSPHTGWTKRIKYSLRKYIHGMMQVIGTALAISGSAHIIHLIPSAYKSAHGILGIMSLACLCLNFLFGVLNVVSPKGLVIKSVHSIVGTLTLLFAFLSFLLGFKVFFITGYKNIGIIGIILAVIALIGVVVSAVITTMRRVCS